MKVEYNGVVMDLVEITEYQRECVYSSDNTDLLYVKHRLGLVCVLAAGGWPAGLSVTRLTPRTFPDLDKNAALRRPSGPDEVRGKTVNDPGFPKQVPNLANALLQYNPGFYTDHEVRMRLAVPRKKLKITAYHPDGDEYVWLESPRPFLRGNNLVQRAQPFYDDAETDAANGPLPLRVDVVNPAGEGTSLGIHFMIETCLVPTAPEQERLILSHRWEVRHTHDDDHYLTRITSGVCVFNGGLMRLTHQSADWYRNQFFHPIPVGFVRKVPEVVASPDGLAIRYTITDTDPRVCFDPGDSGATNIDIVESLNYFQPNALVGSLF